jgi:hypothetical protein
MPPLVSSCALERLYIRYRSATSGLHLPLSHPPAKNGRNWNGGFASARLGFLGRRRARFDAGGVGLYSRCFLLGFARTWLAVGGGRRRRRAGAIGRCFLLGHALRLRASYAAVRIEESGWAGDGRVALVFKGRRRMRGVGRCHQCLLLRVRLGLRACYAAAAGTVR